MDLPWAAGLVDAEGSFSVNRCGAYSYPRFQIKMTDEDVIRRLSSEFGLTVWKCNDGRTDSKPLFTCAPGGKKSLQVAKDLSPWLSSRRRAKIAELGGELLEPKSDTETWLAGVLEGEGYFGRPDKTPVVSIEMSDYDTILRVGVFLGLEDKVRERKPRANRPSSHKPTWSIQLSGSNARKTMHMVLPYMGARRTEQITNALGI